MKTTIYLIALVLFGAHVLTPKMPKQYPPKRVLQMRESISYQEIRLNHLIDKIQYQLVKDSIEIKTIKK